MVHNADTVREKQLQVWDVSDDPRWRLTIYDPIYDGQVFANTGGPQFLDYVGAFAGLGPEHRALELGSGMGDGCKYVASRFGCRVTGVEMSAHQFERAHDRHNNSKSLDLEFVQADMLEWEPSEIYDVVFFGDMLAVAENRRAVLERSFRWLRPGGALAMTDLVAGPNISDADRGFLWQEDGFDNLPQQEEGLAMIHEAGFQELDVTDITHTAVTLNERILEESYRHKSILVAAVGIDDWQEWVECAKNYRRLFAERKLVSLRIGTRRL